MAERSAQRISLEEYERMIATGLLTKAEKVELIEGEIVEMSPIGEAHACCVRALNRLFHLNAADSFLVDVQSPLRMGAWSLPQPDVAVLRNTPERYRERHPGPEDTFLVIEVCDSSLDPDLRVKVPLYARCGVAEVWLIDLPGERIHRFRSPREGRWDHSDVVSRGGEVAPAALPALRLQVNDILDG